MDSEDPKWSEIGLREQGKETGFTFIVTPEWGWGEGVHRASA